MVRFPALLAAGVLALAACSTGQPAASAPSPPPPSPSASPARTVRIGEPWDVSGWRITATGLTCGASAGVNGAGPACVLALAYTNTGDRPALFTGTAGSTDSPLYAAVGYDGQGRAYDGAHSLEVETNPGASGTATLQFAVGPGVRLVRVVLAGATVQA